MDNKDYMREDNLDLSKTESNKESLKRQNLMVDTQYLSKTRKMEGSETISHPTPLPEPGRYFPKLICLGDSLTQRGFGTHGWCSILADNCARKCDVINRGFSGYTSRMAKYIVDNILSCDNCPKGIIAAAIILFGSNDGVIPSLDERGVPLDEYRENMTILVDKFISLGLKKIIVMSPPPVDVLAWARYCTKAGYAQSLDNERTKRYAEECTRMCKERGIVNINLWEQMQKEKNWEKFFADGLHFSKEGNEYIADALLKELGKVIHDLPLVYPLWIDIDPVHPESQLSISKTM